MNNDHTTPARHRPEQTRLTLGFIPLCDCAPLVVAHEYGFFADEGLDVTLSRESSWASLRYKVSLGLLDGAQMLAAMPLASFVGVGVPRSSLVTALSLSLNGNAITVSDGLYQRMMDVDPKSMRQRSTSAVALRRVIESDRGAGRAPLTLAMVHPVSSHNYQLRYWLASGGIDPDRDVRIIVTPPANMVDTLAAGDIDGYCVGAPWNQVAVRAGLGHVVVTGHDIWNNAPEKVFGVHRNWAADHPNSHRALIRALLRACQWLDTPGAREQIAPIMAARQYINADVEALRAIYGGRIQYHPHGPVDEHADHCVFHRYAANFPWQSHARWFLEQMIDCGQLDAETNTRFIAGQVYQTDLYRDVAADIGIAAPGVDSKPEGLHDGCWTLGQGAQTVTLGPDLFLDGAVFEPERRTASAGDEKAAQLVSSTAHADGSAAY